MNLKQLEYFVRVAELGSFSKAALLLDVAQPALSRQVRLLETDLRCALLQRTGRGVVLTEAGKRLFDHSIGILQLVQQARGDLEARRDEPTGRVVVGLSPSLGRVLILPLADRFRDTLPKARLTVVEGLSTHIIEWIASGRVDIGLVLNPEAQAAIDIQPVLDEPLCLISPSSHRPRRLATRAETPRAETQMPFAELPQYPLVIPERTHSIRRLIEAQATLSGIKLNVAWEVSSVQSILDLVRTGHGNAVLTPGAVRASGRPRAFRVRPLTEPQLCSKLCLATSAHKPATPLLRRVTQMLNSLVLNRVGGRSHIKS